MAVWLREHRMGKACVPIFKPELITQWARKFCPSYKIKSLSGKIAMTEY